jgi:hypothetical protein
VVDLPVPDTERPPADQAHGDSERWLHQKRRERWRPSPNTTAALLLGTAGAALALGLTVTFMPLSRTDYGSLPEIPTIPTVSPASTATGGAGAPVTPSFAGTPPATVVPPAAPPLPAQSSSPPRQSIPSAPPAAPPPPPRPSPPAIPTTFIEAESGTNTLGGRVGIHNLAEASGGHTIGWIGKGSANTLRINGLGVPVSGTYRVTVFYISGDGDRTATIRVNGRLIGAATFPGTADWRTVDSVAMRLDLGAGNNSIEFGNPDGPAPDIDRLALGS